MPGCTKASMTHGHRPEGPAATQHEGPGHRTNNGSMTARQQAAARTEAHARLPVNHHVASKHCYPKLQGLCEAALGAGSCYHHRHHHTSCPARLPGCSCALGLVLLTHAATALYAASASSAVCCWLPLPHRCVCCGFSPGSAWMPSQSQWWGTAC